MLFFHCLSKDAHRDLKKKNHNNSLMGSYTVPRTYDKVLQLADQYKPTSQQRQQGGEQGSGIAFAQKGKAEKPTNKAAKSAGNDSTNKKQGFVPGEKNTAGKMVPNSSGKKNCFNCGMDDHWVVNCPKLPQSQRNKLARTANISIGRDDLNAVGFLQSKS